MSEYKFRLWDRKRREMFGWDQIKHFELWQLNGFEQFPNGSAESRHVCMAYTGYKDRLGREVYDGDILTVEDQEGTYRVAWAHFDDCCIEGETWLLLPQFWRNSLWEACKDGAEVIGNIYETPEKWPPALSDPDAARAQESKADPGGTNEARAAEWQSWVKAVGGCRICHDTNPPSGFYPLLSYAIRPGEMSTSPLMCNKCSTPAERVGMTITNVTPETTSEPTD